MAICIYQLCFTMLGVVISSIVISNIDGQCVAKSARFKLMSEGYDYANNALSFHNSQSVHQCAAQCRQHGQCNLFHFCKPNASCELMMSISADDNQTSAKLAAKESCHTYVQTNIKVIKPRDCQDALDSGYTNDGVYYVYPSSVGSPLPIRVYCDMTTDGGGWTVFQRRQDASVNFYRGWEEYEHGFGNLQGNFWLGNDLIFWLTNPPEESAKYELRVDMEDFDGEKAYAKYGRFRLGDASSKYTLYVSDYNSSSTAGDSLDATVWKGVSHANHPFSTLDQDNDDVIKQNCAVKHTGALWFSNCVCAHLNGRYAERIDWCTWTSSERFLKHVEMKLRIV